MCVGERRGRAAFLYFFLYHGVLLIFCVAFVISIKDLSNIVYSAVACSSCMRLMQRCNTQSLVQPVLLHLLKCPQSTITLV